MQTTHRRKPYSTHGEQIVISEVLAKVLSSAQVTTLSDYENPPEATKNTFIKVDEGKEIKGWYQAAVGQIPSKQVYVVWGSPDHSVMKSDFPTNVQPYEAEDVKHWYQEELSKILEVKQIVYKQDKKRIEFIVAVDRIRRKLSQQLSRIEFQLYNEYTDWFFDFKHSGIHTFSQWSLDGYANLYSRD